jgi:hypothetical protein
MHRFPNRASKFAIPILVLLMVATLHAQNTDHSNGAGTYRIAHVSTDQTYLDLENAQGETRRFAIQDEAVREVAKEFGKGDLVRVASREPADANTPPVITLLAAARVSISVRRRITVLICALLALVIITVAITRASPAKLCIGQDGLYSNSQFQLVAWFTALIVSYIAAVWFRSWDIHDGFLAGINIPINILLLSGASALTFGSAKGITANKVAEAVRTTGVNPKLPKDQVARLFYDLTHNDLGQFDLGDFQMVVITLLSVTMYILLVFTFLGSLETRRIVSLPDIDTTVLAAFGLGQGAYLTKKAFGNAADS